MKNITLLLCLLISSLSFGQVLLEDFEGAAPTVGSANGAPVPTIVADPAGINGDVLRVITVAAQAPWQQAELVLQNGPLDLSGTDKRVSVDWYSTTPFDALLGVSVSTTATQPDKTSEAAHTGGGWETLVFDFALQAQTLGQATANNYQQMFFFNLWDIDLNDEGDFINTPNASGGIASTTYVDNISKGVAVTSTWSGASSSDWDDASNWDFGVPTASVNVIIPNVANDPVASGAISVKSMVLQPDAALTVAGAVTNSGAISVGSGASFIAKTSVSGTVSYARDLSSTNWHYIASPVVGQDEDDFVLASGLQLGSTGYGFCTFDTDVNYWEFYQNGTSSGNVLNPGQGYIVNLDGASGTVTFSGDMNVGNETVVLAITGEGYNLLGNPYPSYLDSNAMLTASSGALLSQTIWLWDQSTETYETKVAADNFEIAPGQGFFIQSNGAAGTVSITEGMQSHQATDTFLRTDSRPEVQLTLSDGLNTNSCKVYYVDGATSSFDNGFDGPKFRAFEEPLSIYTHLVTNGFGRDYGIQSVPNNDYENLIIPVGLHATAGTSVTISANAIHLPEGIDIYLEDRDENTFTILDATSNFSFTPATDLNGIGRFYLRTSDEALSVNESLATPHLQIYALDATQEVIINGSLTSSSLARIYDLQGKLVLSQNLDQSKTKQTIDISAISSGLYVVQVDSGSQLKTQKISKK